MVFFLPILVVIALLFGFDYFYFQNEDGQAAKMAAKMATKTEMRENSYAKSYLEKQAAELATSREYLDRMMRGEE